MRIKRIARIGLWTGVSFVALTGLAYLLLWLPPVQQKIKDIALSEIRKKTHNLMIIDELRFIPFNRLALEGVYVEDLSGDTLLSAGELSVSFNLWKLLDNQLLIKSVALENWTLHITQKEPQSEYNFQFLLDAFASENPDSTSSSLLIKIHDVKLVNGQVRYDVLSELEAMDETIDYNHLLLSDIQANVDLNSLDPKKMDSAVNSLSFKEKSGFILNRFSAGFQSEDDRYILEDLQISLPHSEIALKNACLEQDTYWILLQENRIHPQDIQMFYPKLASLTEDFVLSGMLDGTLPEISISQLTIDYGSHIGLSLQGLMHDFHDWKTTPVHLRLDRASADSQGMRQLLDFLSSGGEQLKLPVDAGSVYLTGRLDGTLPDLSVDLAAQTGRGGLRLAGTGGYDLQTKTVHFDAGLTATQLDLRTILQDTLFGTADFQLYAKGTTDASAHIQATGNIQVERLDFNGYVYHTIEAEATYDRNRLQGQLRSRDANVPLSLDGSAFFGGKRSEAHLTAQLDSVYLEPLHFLTSYTKTYLSGNIRLDVNGLNPEKMALDLYVDRFALHTDKGSFREPEVRFCYLATDSSKKRLDISSLILNGNADGAFTYKGVMQSFINAFPMFFPKKQLRKAMPDTFADNLSFRFSLHNAHSLTRILDLPEAVPDSALFIGKYNDDGQLLRLSASAYTQFSDRDTLQLSLSLTNKDNRLAFIFNVDNRSAAYDVDGSIDAEVAFIPKQGSSFPDMNISLNPTVLVLNETDFQLHPAEIEVQDNRYLVHNFWLDHSGSEYVRADGTISRSDTDSLKLTVSQFQLGTIFNAMKTPFPLSGMADGEILGKRLLSAPLVLSRGFAIRDILFDSNAIGDLTLRSIWNSERKGLALRATLGKAGNEPSVIMGFVRPEKDSLALTANIRNMELQWLNPYLQSSLYGLDGTLNANLKIDGRLRQPSVNGVVYFDSARVGVRMLNTFFTTSDSIYVSPDQIQLKRFTIRDKEDHTLVANGQVSHRNFTGFNPAINLSLSNFLALDNASQIDSLFFGKLWVNGILSVKKNNKDWLISGNMLHADHSYVRVNVPTSSVAETYNSITFIHTENEQELTAESGRKKKEKFTLPLKLNIAFWLDPSLTVGAVFNPTTRDVAEVAGNGSMNFSYDLNNGSMNLLGDYTITTGKASLSLASLSLANITKKTFTVQEGGKLTFVGNPMATTFDLTALYNLRADLTTLDPSFESIGLASTKIPVECALTATGSLNQMELKYNILLPNQPDEIQRKVSGLLYTDDAKIKEIAYLLALGAFYPVNSDNMASSSNQIWTTLASSSITTQLNSLLSSVLSENWSIGTDLHGSDGSFNDMNMDVNISTRLFNNRLTINSTLGFNSNPNQTNNFTGDFDLEYKLVSSGNLLLKAYNITNNQYFERAKTTQGVGLAYKRSGRTFRQLFDYFRKEK
ncbi:MAG: translocation/assembly module TamB domain-containing protein [Dysgonamonadaceae bacterium]|nr:translocation/assembly module TamB domain-containing protein [Dysgonamonadaceae bacterium]